MGLEDRARYAIDAKTAEDAAKQSRNAAAVHQLRQDCQVRLAEFVDFVRARGIEPEKIYHAGFKRSPLLPQGSRRANVFSDVGVGWRLRATVWGSGTRIAAVTDRLQAFRVVIARRHEKGNELLVIDSKCARTLHPYNIGHLSADDLRAETAISVDRYELQAEMHELADPLKSGDDLTSLSEAAGDRWFERYVEEAAIRIIQGRYKEVDPSW